MISKKEIIKNLESIGILLIKNNVKSPIYGDNRRGILFKFPKKEGLLLIDKNKKSISVINPNDFGGIDNYLEYANFSRQIETKTVENETININICWKDIIHVLFKIELTIIKNKNCVIDICIKNEINFILRKMCLDFLHNKMETPVFLDAIKDELEERGIYVF